MSEQLDTMKSTLMACAMSRMGDLEHTDAKELGEVVDMIKDLEEAKYYCTITEAMEERSKSDDTQSKIDNALMVERMRNQSEMTRAYTEPYNGAHVRYPDRRFDDYGRMYYDGLNHDRYMYYDGRDNRRDGERSYTQPNYSSANYPMLNSYNRDSREGKSYISRRGYMESKENHMPDSVKMDKLEEYIKELGEDITDMIREASPTEKSMIKDKLKKLSDKIS